MDNNKKKESTIHSDFAAIVSYIYKFFETTSISGIIYGLSKWHSHITKREKPIDWHESIPRTGAYRSLFFTAIYILFSFNLEYFSVIKNTGPLFPHIGRSVFFYLIIYSSITTVLYLVLWQICYTLDGGRGADPEHPRYLFSPREQIRMSAFNLIEVVIHYAIIFWAFRVLYPGFFLSPESGFEMDELILSLSNVTTLTFASHEPKENIAKLICLSESVVCILFLVVNLPLLASPEKNTSTDDA